MTALYSAKVVKIGKKCTFGGPSPQTVPPSEKCPIRTLTPFSRGIVRQCCYNDLEVNKPARGRKLLKIGKMYIWGALTPKRYDLEKTHGNGH